MPRISKFVTAFNVEDQPYVATFTHLHDDKGVRIDTGSGIASKVIHVTRCYLKTPHEIVDGVAACSKAELLDTGAGYQWRLGIKTALSRALDKLNLTQKQRGQFFQSFYTEIRIKEYPANGNSPSV